MTVAAASTTTQRGAWAEGVALEHLRDAGLQPIARNYRCRHGEVDLVMGDGDVLVMVEVRYRRSGALVDGAQSIDAGKQRRLTATAEHWLQRHREHASRACRFDVVSVSGQPGAPVVDWIPGAFEA